MFVAARPRAARSPRQCACLGLVRGYRAAAKNKESGTVDYNAVPPASQWKDVLKFGREKRVLISNPATAAAFAKAILSGSGGDRPNLPKTFIEAFPGPGLLTRKLLEYPPTQVKKIIVLEDSASCWPYLTALQEQDPRVVLVKKSGFLWSTYRDMRDEGILDDIPIHPWDDVHPHLRFVAQLPGANQGEQLISQLVRYISDRSWLYNLGRLRMDFLMPEAILERLVAQPGSFLRCKLSVAAEANAETQQTLPSLRFSPTDKHIFPKPTLMVKSDPSYCAVKLTPRPNPVVTGKNLDHWDFVLRKLFVLKSTNLAKAIATLAPGAQNMLPSIQQRGVDTTKNVRSLSLDEWTQIMEVFAQWPFAPQMLYNMEKINPRLLKSHQR